MNVRSKNSVFGGRPNFGVGPPWECPPPPILFQFSTGTRYTARTPTPMHAKCARSLYTDSGLVKMYSRVSDPAYRLWVSMKIKWYHISAIYRARATKLIGLVELVGGYCTMAPLQAYGSPFGRYGAPNVFLSPSISPPFLKFLQVFLHYTLVLHRG